MRAILAATVATLLLAGCGAAGATGDPFAGTWTPADQQGSTSIIIAKATDGYRAVFEQNGQALFLVRFARHDNRLTSLPSMMARTLLDYHSDTGQLTYTQSGGTTEFHKASDKTAFPSPLPPDTTDGGGTSSP